MAVISEYDAFVKVQEVLLAAEDNEGNKIYPNVSILLPSAEIITSSWVVLAPRDDDVLETTPNYPGKIKAKATYFYYSAADRQHAAKGFMDALDYAVETSIPQIILNGTKALDIPLNIRGMAVKYSEQSLIEQLINSISQTQTISPNVLRSTYLDAVIEFQIERS